MYVTSSAFTEGDTIPARFASRRVPGGTDASIPLAWEGEPAGTASYVLELIDHHPVAKGFVHWLVIDIPGSTHELPEGASRTAAMPAGAIELGNTGGRAGYAGPNPPAGSGAHDYEARIIALDVPRLGLHADATLAEVQAVVRAHELADASVTGYFEQ